MGKQKVYDSDISTLQFDDKNFNKHTKRGMDMLKSSVGDNGFGRSILVDKDDNIIAGNGIVETANTLGKTKIRVVETTGEELIVVKRTDMSLNSPQGREMALADNASAAVDLDWDEDALREISQEFDMDFSKYGIDMDALSDISQETDEEGVSDASDVQEDEYDEDLVTAPRKAHFGDIWQMGEHRVICGDSTDPDTVKRLLAGEQVDLLLTDPPYNVAYNKGDHDAIANDNLSNDEFHQFLVKAFSGAIDVMRAGASFYIWYAIAEHTNFDTAAKEVGFKVSEYLLWVKNALVLGRLDYHYRHEPCLYGWKTGAGHNWYGDRSQTTVLEFAKPTKSVDHPTMKPVPMFAYQMQNSTKKNDIVLDIFGGSGTTMVAAQELGRKARLVEFEEKYVNIIIDRYIKLVGSHEGVYRINPDGTHTAYEDVE